MRTSPTNRPGRKDLEMAPPELGGRRDKCGLSQWRHDVGTCLLAKVARASRSRLEVPSCQYAHVFSRLSQRTQRLASIANTSRASPSPGLTGKLIRFPGPDSASRFTFCIRRSSTFECTRRAQRLHAAAQTRQRARCRRRVGAPAPTARDTCAFRPAAARPRAQVNPSRSRFSAHAANADSPRWRGRRRCALRPL